MNWQSSRKICWMKTRDILANFFEKTLSKILEILVGFNISRNKQL